jgi:putative peptide zinc metalloprotease protein
VIYSLASWIYRFFVFAGIALLVYHLTFKALGIVLAAIEVWFFIARPIVAELTVWSGIVAKSRLNKHTFVTLAVMLLILILLFIPWRGRVDVPGLLRAEQQAVLLAAEPGRLVAMAKPNTQVTEGEELFRLESADITHSTAVARAQLETAQAALVSSSFDADRRRGHQASYARVSEAAAALWRAETRAATLVVRAPFAGELKDVPPDLRIGDDIRRLERLGILIASTVAVVEAYVTEADLDRVRTGASARLILLDGRTLPLVVSEIAHVSTRALDVPELASTNEGPIAVRRGTGGTLVPERAIYRVILTTRDPSAETMSRLAGRIVIEAAPRSFIDILYRKAVALIIRESSM